MSLTDGQPVPLDPDEPTLVGTVAAELRHVADPTRAPQMQAYMKSAMPYLGVPLPVTRRIARSAAAAIPPSGVNDLLASATALWRAAEFREERYAAAELTGLRIAAGRLEMLPLYWEMIVTGAWWDHVDGISDRIGGLLLAHRPVIEPVLRAMVDRPRLLAAAEQHHLPTRAQTADRRATADRRSSSPISPTASSSSARRSAGRCGSTPASIRTGSGPSSKPMRRPSARCPGARR